MSITINKDRCYALRSALQSATGKCMTICEMNSPLEDKLTWGVNWAALGTQTPQDTLCFVLDLNDAATITKALNDMGLELVWEDDPTINNIEETICRKASIEYYNSLQEIIYKCLILQDWDQLKKILSNDTKLYDIIPLPKK